MYTCLCVTYPLFFSDFNQIEFSRQIFEKFSNTKFHENPSSASRVVPMRTNRKRDGRTDTTKPIVALRNSATGAKHAKVMVAEGSRYSDWAAGCTTEKSRLECWQGAEDLFFSKPSRPPLGPNQPPIQSVPVAVSKGVERQGREANQ
jgi:hypothetical protein